MLLKLQYAICFIVYWRSKRSFSPHYKYSCFAPNFVVEPNTNENCTFFICCFQQWNARNLMKKKNLCCRLLFLKWLTINLLALIYTLKSVHSQRLKKKAYWVNFIKFQEKRHLLALNLNFVSSSWQELELYKTCSMFPKWVMLKNSVALEAAHKMWKKLK